ncbi:MAG: FG-GAP repeat protein, partial [Victivallales bacterium]|nr:FG-GAP repeat protein [Victivallales bacterium]
MHPSRSGAVADLDGDGLDEVLCGTHYYAMQVLNGKGQRIWRASFGPICWAIATGNFDGDKTRGVIAGSGNGFAYMFDSKGKRLLD